MDAQTILLLAAVACLLVAQFLLMLQPHKKAAGAGTVTIDAAQLAELRNLGEQLRAELADLAKQTGARLPVKQTPPESDRLKPAPVKQHKPAQLGGQRRRDGGKARSARG